MEIENSYSQIDQQLNLSQSDKIVAVPEGKRAQSVMDGTSLQDQVVEQDFKENHEQSNAGIELESVKIDIISQQDAQVEQSNLIDQFDSQNEVTNEGKLILSTKFISLIISHIF